MLVLSVGIAFSLLFAVLIFDAISSSYAGTAGNRTDVSQRSSKPASEVTRPAGTTAETGSSRTFGDRPPLDGTELAA